MATLDLGNVMGPQGPQGPQGETGPQGPQGPQGEQGPPADTSTLILKTEKGAANGVATLDGSSKLTASQFPNPNNVGVYSLNAGSNIPSNADLNEYVTPGTYYCNASTAATLSNAPVSNSGIHLIVQYVTGSASSTQTIIAGNGLIYHRYHYDTSFGDWQRVLTAVNDRFYGSNQYGTWQKLPSGLMIEWGAATSGTISAGSWEDVTFSFPLVFSSPPFIIAVPRYDSSRDITLNVGGSSTSGAWCHVYFGGNGSDTVGINWMAIGSY